MDRISALAALVNEQFAKLSASQRLLIGSLAIILVMSLFVVQQYAARPVMIELLPGVASEEQSQAVRALSTSGIEHETSEDGRLLVAPSAKRAALAVLTEQRAMPSDGQVLFDNLIEKQSWTNSMDQNHQLEMVAVQNELAGVISQMRNIHSANVILNVPKRRSLSTPITQPSAAVTVFPSGAMGADTVDAIAGLVASSRGIPIERVTVIDGNTQRSHRARSEDSFTASSYLEEVRNHERHKHQQIYDMLSAYIDGVIVAVHAQVDTTRRTMTQKQVAPNGEGSGTLVQRERTEELQRTEPRRGGEPGPRSNTREDVTASASGGNASTTESKTETEFATEFGTTVEQIIDGRGNATKINAVINIPRPYFVSIWQQQQGAGAAEADGDAPAEPTEADLEPIIEAETTRIEREVLPLIDTSSGADSEPGTVQVSMIPTMPRFAMQSGGTQAGGFIDSIGGDAGVGGLVKNLAIGALALISLGLVFLTAAKSTKRDDLPDASELVGIPKALEGDGDLLGEVGEADGALEGVELDDDEMQSRKLLEQVTAMVDEDPETSARLLTRWVQQEE
ncbi:MAG: flagellar M-ring protein FliF C-terminal domain-containing protein [Planctomycetota bacterium]